MAVKDIVADIKQKYADDETHIGDFSALNTPPLYLKLLTGPLVTAFLSKPYIVAVTDKQIHFSRLNLFSKVEQTDSFTYLEIPSLSISSGWMNYTLKFQFGNGNKLKLKIHKARMNNDVLAHLKKSFLT